MLNTHVVSKARTFRIYFRLRNVSSTFIERSKKAAKQLSMHTQKIMKYLTNHAAIQVFKKRVLPITDDLCFLLISCTGNDKTELL